MHPSTGREEIPRHSICRGADPSGTVDMVMQVCVCLAASAAGTPASVSIDGEYMVWPSRNGRIAAMAAGGHDAHEGRGGVVTLSAVPKSAKSRAP